jgi:hypothetical protein
LVRVSAREPILAARLARVGCDSAMLSVIQLLVYQSWIGKRN